MADRRHRAGVRALEFEEVIAALKITESQKDEICKDYFNERHRVQGEEKPTQEVKERLLLAQEILKQKLAAEKKKLDTETSYKADLLKTKANDFNSKFRNKAQKKETQLAILKD